VPKRCHSLYSRAGDRRPSPQPDRLHCTLGNVGAGCCFCCVYTGELAVWGPHPLLLCAAVVVVNMGHHRNVVPVQQLRWLPCTHAHTWLSLGRQCAAVARAYAALHLLAAWCGNRQAFPLRLLGRSSQGMCLLMVRWSTWLPLWLQLLLLVHCGKSEHAVLCVRAVQAPSSTTA
jgi:hypothetical protein